MCIEQNKKEEKIEEEKIDYTPQEVNNKNKYFLVAGSYDSTISFWEFDLDQLPLNTSSCTEVSCNAAYDKPSQKDQKEALNKFFFINNIQTFEYQPVCQLKVSVEGVGQIIIHQQYLIINTFDGKVIM